MQRKKEELIFLFLFYGFVEVPVFVPVLVPVPGVFVVFPVLLPVFVPGTFSLSPFQDQF